MTTCCLLTPFSLSFAAATSAVNALKLVRVAAPLVTVHLVVAVVVVVETAT